MKQLKCTYINREVHNTYVQTDDLENKTTFSQTDIPYFKAEILNSCSHTDELCFSDDITEKINVEQKSRFLKTEITCVSKAVHHTYAQTDHIGEICLNSKLTKESKFSQTDKPLKKSSKGFSKNRYLHVSVQTEFEDKEKEFYLSENKNLTHKIELYEETLRLLKDEMKQPKINVFSQTDFSDSAIASDVQTDIDDILKEMLILPRLISPIPFEKNVVDKQIPSIVVTSSLIENNDNISAESVELGNNLIDAKNQISKKPVTIEEDQCSLEKPLRRRKNNICFTYNDYIRQQSWLLRQRKLAFKKKLNKRRRKSTLPNDGLMNSLNALKKSNIKFIISNESALPQYPKYCTNLYNNHKTEHKPKSKIIKKQFNIAKVSPQCIETLQCDLGGCKKMCMLVNNTPEGSELLGFFSIKPEAVTPTVLYSEPISRVNQLDPISTLNKDVSSSIIIEQIANIVCEKLKNDGITVKNSEPTHSSANIFSNNKYFDSFCSETETEIERLFKKNPLEILQQNKRLVNQAHYRNFGNTSTDESTHSNTEDTFSDARSDTASIFGEQSSGRSTENSGQYIPLLTVDNSKSKATKPATNNSLDCFKVPVCPQLLSPIYSNASTDFNKSPTYLSPPVMCSCPALMSPINSTPIASKSVKKLVFNSPQKSENVGDISVNSNLSFCIDKIMEDRNNLSYNLNRFIGILPDDLSVQKSNVNTENVPPDSGHLEDFVKSSESLQNCSKLETKTELPHKSTFPESATNENTCQESSSFFEANTKNYSPGNRRMSKSIDDETGQNFLENSQMTGNNVDENDRLCYVNNDCLDPSDNEVLLTNITQERHKCLDRHQVECLRRSKRLIDQNSPSSIMKRKRLKSLSLKSSDGEQDSLESPKSPVDDFDKGIKPEKSLHLGLSDSEENSMKSSYSPLANFEERMKLEKEENVGGGNVDSYTLQQDFTVNKSHIKKNPAKLLTSSDKSSRVRKKKKPVSKLKSRVLQQIKRTSKMMGTRKYSDVANCDILDNSDKIENTSKDLKQFSVDFSEKSTISQVKHINEDEGIFTDQSETQSVNSGETNNITNTLKLSQNSSSNTSTEETDCSRKIHIVQNILIPPKSRFAIDLLKNNRKQKKTDTSSDILCEILHNMDKDKPVVKKDFSKDVSDNNPLSIDDKKFRNNVLDIAEVLHSGVKFSNYQYKNMPSRDKSVVESRILQKGRNLPS